MAAVTIHSDFGAQENKIKTYNLNRIMRKHQIIPIEIHSKKYLTSILQNGQKKELLSKMGHEMLSQSTGT